MPEELTLLPLPCPACGHPAGIARANGTGCAFVMCQHVKCAFSGPIKTTSEAAVAAWNALPRALEWTTEPPKVPGCYLGRKKGGRISMVIYCFYQKDELGFWNGKKFCTFEQDATEYFGPIPEPREPKE